MGETVYSISRLDAINRCLREAYQTYRLGDRGENNIYTYLGSRTHQVLEDIVKGEATEADLLPAVEQELADLDIFGISFPKDARGGDSIRNGWIEDMMHFCNTYKSPTGKNLETELEINYTTPKGNKLVGYIDLLKINKDGSVEIYDYKTSSLYSKQEKMEHGRQLVVYALGLQQHGFDVKCVAWIMLKYVDVTYMGFKTSRSKEKTEIKKTIERRKLVRELKDSISIELVKIGKDEFDIDLIMEEALKTNIIPKEVAHLYKIRPCVIEYDLTDEVIDECINYIDNTIEKWETLSDEECANSHREFTRTQQNGKVVQSTFYCGCLCPHRNTCPHYADFKAQQPPEETNYEDLFD